MALTAANIRTTLETDISAGHRQPGDQLPPVRHLAEELGVSPNTVASAYKQLRERGMVIGRGRQGTRVAARNQPTFSQIAPVPDGAVDALRGSPDESLLPDLAPAFAAATSSRQARYGDQLLDAGFAAAARSMFEVDGVDATHIAATSGAMDAIEKILTTNGLRPGDRVGVEDPGHIPVHQLVRGAGMEPVALAIDELGVLPKALDEALARGLSALVVTPRAQNPTGAAFSASRALELSGVLASHPPILVIQDDHAGVISGAGWYPLKPHGDRYAIVRSLGKSLGPDLRVSVTAGDANTIDRLALAVSNGPGWVSHLLQRAAAFLLTDEATSRLVARAEVSYAARRQRLITALAELGVPASGASGINVWIPTHDEQFAVEAARVAGFAIRAADSYRLNAGPAVRVTISNLTDHQIDEVAAALGSALSSGRKSPSM